MRHTHVGPPQQACKPALRPRPWRGDRQRPQRSLLECPARSGLHPAAARRIAIVRAFDHHRGMARGFLPRGSSDTRPQVGADRCLAACVGGCPTTLNKSCRWRQATLRPLAWLGHLLCCQLCGALMWSPPYGRHPAQWRPQPATIRTRIQPACARCCAASRGPCLTARRRCT